MVASQNRRVPRAKAQLVQEITLLTVIVVNSYRQLAQDTPKAHLHHYKILNCKRAKHSKPCFLLIMHAKHRVRISHQYHHNYLIPQTTLNNYYLHRYIFRKIKTKQLMYCRYNYHCHHSQRLCLSWWVSKYKSPTKMKVWGNPLIRNRTWRRHISLFSPQYLMW